MMGNFEEVANLEEAAAKASDAVKVGDVKFNYCLAVSVPAIALVKFPLRDKTELARQWQLPEPPSNFHFNHGMYIGDGVEHITNELQSKPSSNRALYSLLHQNNISKSGDKPIPSFMIMQCGIENRTLYCTVYFRALEVSTFLRINIEEIRLTLCHILEKNIDIDTIKLTIFAFKAYNKREQSTLQRSRLDMMTSIGLSDK